MCHWEFYLWLELRNHLFVVAHVEKRRLLLHPESRFLVQVKQALLLSTPYELERRSLRWGRGYLPCPSGAITSYGVGVTFEMPPQSVEVRVARVSHPSKGLVNILFHHLFVVHHLDSNSKASRHISALHRLSILHVHMASD